MTAASRRTLAICLLMGLFLGVLAGGILVKSRQPKSTADDGAELSVAEGHKSKRVLALSEAYKSESVSKEDAALLKEALDRQEGLNFYRALLAIGWVRGAQQEQFVPAIKKHLGHKEHEAFVADTLYFWLQRGGQERVRRLADGASAQEQRVVNIALLRYEKLRAGKPVKLKAYALKSDKEILLELEQLTKGSRS